ncbi:hypothetical protein KKH3_24630 [Pectobacterium actinidiae]|nr:hypothetical protein KKH3_24630 [Pectobacterium actinidiae]
MLSDANPRLISSIHQQTDAFKWLYAYPYPPPYQSQNQPKDDVFLLTAGAQFHDRTAHYS